MCQARVLKYLQKNKEATVREISRDIKLGRGTCSCNLSRLRKQHLVKKVVVKANTRRGIMYLYKII